MMNRETLVEITRMATALQTAAPPPAVKDWLAVAALRAAACDTSLLADACNAVADLLEGTKP